jgi:hypothetical protein
MSKLVEIILDGIANLSEESSIGTLKWILADIKEEKLVVYDSLSYPECEELARTFIQKNAYLYTDKVGFQKSIYPAFVFEVKNKDKSIYSKGFTWKNGYVFILPYEEDYILYLAIDKSTKTIFGYPDATLPSTKSK